MTLTVLVLLVWALVTAGSTLWYARALSDVDQRKLVPPHGTRGPARI